MNEKELSEALRERGRGMISIPQYQLWRMQAKLKRARHSRDKFLDQCRFLEEQMGRYKQAYWITRCQDAEKLQRIYKD